MITRLINLFRNFFREVNGSFPFLMSKFPSVKEECLRLVCDATENIFEAFKSNGPSTERREIRNVSQLKMQTHTWRTV